MSKYFAVVSVMALVHFQFASAQSPEDSELRLAAENALRRAITYYVNQVAQHGGYVYYYSADLTRCWGEGETTRDTIWVQPPGTPTVGLAYLAAYDATGDAFYRDAAHKAAQALCYGQLESGGWTNKVCFAKSKRMGKYRNGRGDDWNMTSLDDGQTQTALRFLIAMDAVLAFKDEQIHEAVGYALDALLEHQFRNGAFAQGWDDDEMPQSRPRKASYPDYDWRSERKVKAYWDLYTLNDDNAVYLAETLIAAHKTYRKPALKRALEKLGDFLITAQMPDPQPAWAQQYHYDMRPAWARKFEPPAISSSESMGVMRTLIQIYRYTGKRKYLRPIPPALAYLKTCLLPDGQLARYYELESNKPLYMQRKSKNEYVLTYDDSDLPGHYGWKRHSHLGAIERDYQRALQSREKASPPSVTQLEPKVHAILAALDEQGRWLSTASGGLMTGQPGFVEGQSYLSSAVFAQNVETLSQYISRASRK